VNKRKKVHKTRKPRIDQKTTVESNRGESTGSIYDRRTIFSQYGKNKRNLKALWSGRINSQNLLKFFYKVSRRVEFSDTGLQDLGKPANDVDSDSKPQIKLFRNYLLRA